MYSGEIDKIIVNFDFGKYENIFFSYMNRFSKNSLLYFDVEENISKKLNEKLKIDNFSDINKENIKFINSEKSVLIQDSDLIVALVYKMFETTKK